MSSVSLAFGVSGLFGPDQTSPRSIGVDGQTPESLPIPILKASSKRHRQDNPEGQQGAPSEKARSSCGWATSTARSNRPSILSIRALSSVTV